VKANDPAVESSLPVETVAAHIMKIACFVPLFAMQQRSSTEGRFPLGGYERLSRL